MMPPFSPARSGIQSVFHRTSFMKPAPRSYLPQVLRSSCDRVTLLVACALLLRATTGCDRQSVERVSVSPTDGLLNDSPGTGADIEADQTYEVLSLAILNAVSHGAVEQHYTLRERPTFEPFPIGDRTKALVELQKVLGEVESIGPDLAAQLMEINRDARPFTPSKFPPQFPVQILTTEEEDAMFRGGAETGWMRFHREKQRGPCVVTASLPAFNKERTKAVMMIWQQRGPLDGEGGFMIARRIGGSWIVYQDWQAPTAVSQHQSAGPLFDRVASNAPDHGAHP
jgi:hypothetical protein